MTDNKRALGLEPRVYGYTGAALSIGLLILMANVYGGDQLWPNFVATLAGAFAGFLLAAELERSRLTEMHAASEREDDERRKREMIALREEATRRLKTVVAELDTIVKNIRDANDAGGGLQLPQLPTGAWWASRDRLAGILTDSQLIADAAAVYERVTELQWRLRWLHTGVFYGDKVLTPLKTSVDELATDVIRSIKGWFPQTGIHEVGLQEKLEKEAGDPLVLGTNVTRRTIFPAIDHTQQRPYVPGTEP